MKDEILELLDIEEIDVSASIYFIVHLTMELDTTGKVSKGLLQAAKDFVAVRIGHEKYRNCKKHLNGELPRVIAQSLMEEALDKEPDNTVH